MGLQRRRGSLQQASGGLGAVGSTLPRKRLGGALSDMPLDRSQATNSAGGTVIDGEAEDVTGPEGEESAPVMRDQHTRDKSFA